MLRPIPIEPVPPETARAAVLPFPKGTGTCDVDLHGHVLRWLPYHAHTWPPSHVRASPEAGCPYGCAERQEGDRQWLGILCVVCASSPGQTDNVPLMRPRIGLSTRD
jgi:hypothetical protein